MRDQIIKHLGAAIESTAKVIASKIGAEQRDVAVELNHLHNEGLVQRQKKGGEGNEYWYRNSTPLTVVHTHVAVTTQDETTAPVDEAVETSSVEEKAEVLEEADFREVDRPLSALLELIGVEATNTDTPIFHAINMVSLSQSLSTFADQKNAQLEETIARLRANNAELERRIDELTIVDADFVPDTVFVTVGRYATPKRHATIEKAQKRASALVKSEKETEVLVLKPVGRVVRGTQWVRA